MVLTNEGGILGETQLFEVGQGPVSVAVADVNGDGHDDLIATSAATDAVTVFLSAGDPLAVCDNVPTPGPGAIVAVAGRPHRGHGGA